ncbi:hypothetical protein [Herbidospora mongoliensis]|uniref:hypothetical protein n=1 Tax=Herbidospora mongoliensis TaxID=688067 RepID=UPI000837823A|nr:hypothetical protein [Herbidospora mongoliensis]
MLRDPVRFFRTVAGTSLLVVPVLYVAGLLIDPAIRAGGGIGYYGAHPGQVSISASVLHWSWVLLVPGILGMIHLARERTPVAAHVTGAIAVLGVINFSSLMLGDFVYSRLERAMEPEAGSALADLALGDPGAEWGFRVPGFLGMLFVMVLALVMAYGKKAPWWAGPAMLVGMLGTPIFPIGTVVGGLAYLAGAGVIGLRMLRMSDAEWAGPAGKLTAAR